MALSDLTLSLMAFPQSWDGANLLFNLLLLPAGNPLANIGAGPRFAGTSYTLQAILIPSLDAAPVDNAPSAIPFALATPAPANAAALFDKLNAALAPTVQVPKNPTGVRIQKALPASYTSSFAFEQPRTNTIVGDAYGCALLDQQVQDPAKPIPAPPPKTVNWGQVISFALQQPKLAAALGLVYTLSIQPQAGDLINGGWLYVRFDPAASPYPPNPLKPDFIKSFAARLPAMAGGRILFAPVLFPVGGADANPALYDQANIEVQEYDDGFAKIVHCNQPKSADAPAEHQNQLVVATDAGIQIGWDDEQVTTWHNRQITPTLAGPVTLPLSVLGYRVDVRQKPADPWTSLCNCTANIAFDPSIDGVFPFEAPVQPAPVRSLAGEKIAWLPRYFAQWAGKSVVVADEVSYQLMAGNKPLAPSILTSQVPPGLLRYGNNYQFRARLVDLTHGGPPLKKDAIHPAPATVGRCNFQRWIRPKAVRTNAQRDALHPETIEQISVWRPLIGYPEMLFAGVSDAEIPALVAQVAKAKANHIVLGASDPDVDTLRIIVEARTPAHDTTAPEQLDGPYRVIYQVDTRFPALLGPIPANPPDPAESITLNLVYQDAANIVDVIAPVAGNPQDLPIPRARDVRLRLLAVAHNANPDYFGDASITEGLTVHLDTRSDIGQESELFDPAQQPVDQMRAIFLQPVPDAAARLAQALDLEVNGLTFSGKPSKRVVFGASGAIRNTLSGDHSSITLATQNELLDHWIIAITLNLNRDWTWDGLQNPSFLVARDGKVVGAIEVRQTVSASAVLPAEDPATQRDVTRLVFFDALNPNPDAITGKYPQVATWTVTPQFKTGLTSPDPPLSITIHLPKAARPPQTPKIASAGIALSPYEPASDYSSTAPRRRALWIEFEEPLADPADAYFARVLAYAPDPLLAGSPPDFPAVRTGDIVDPPMSIDPEPIRVITPGQSADTAGLDAMTELIAATGPVQPRHFLLPLPPGITEDALELFGFWTYEFRVGHAGLGLANWSTAQARFGRPLRATGIQHPAPALKCMAARAGDAIQVIAPFATPTPKLPFNMLFTLKPLSSIWVMLYAQVMQADGASWRNVLLLSRQAQPIPDQLPDPNLRPPKSISRDVYGIASFSEPGDVRGALASLGLPLDSPLSALAVELLPNNAGLQDPLGSGLGGQRLLRTSPLTPVPAIC